MEIENNGKDRINAYKAARIVWKDFFRLRNKHTEVHSI